MSIYTNTNSYFPSQVASDEEKASGKYGLRVAKAIESEWFGQGASPGGGRFNSNYNNFHSLRLYARGEQSTQKYKDELSINGDLSYLNLDWKPVPVLSKFVDIVVNGMSQKTAEIKAFSQDPAGLKQRTQYLSALAQDMYAKPMIENIQSQLGIDMRLMPQMTDAPETPEEIEMHMQLTYKQSIEIAEEEAINNVLDHNKYETKRRRLNYDLAVLGIAAAKTTFNKAEGIVLDYVDPAQLVYSYSEDPNFEDIYYAGEVKSITIPELKKQFPHLTEEQLLKIQSGPRSQSQVTGYANYDRNAVNILYFEYKTYMNQVFKIKMGDNGLEKAIQKTDSFDPPENDNFKRVSRTIDVLYKGALVLGTQELLEWRLAEDMTRPFADSTKVEMNYVISAPRMYKGKIDSLVSRITGFADMIQLTHLKLQQVMSRIVPDGVFLDMDGLAEVDLGNGTTYNPAEALNMYFQTGSVVGRSLTQDGDMNRARVPVQELASSSGQGKIASLINTYQYYLQMIRDVTGLNEARDGSNPDKDALVGLQKMAANQSNVATRHILQAGMYITLRLCENISLKLADVINNPLLFNALQNSISVTNAHALTDMESLALHDFGIYLELEPEDEEKAQLEQNIQVSLQQGSLDLEDAIDLRQIKNLKLANQMLKLRRKKKAEAAQQAQQANIQAQAQANAQASEAAAMAEVQKQQILSEEKLKLEQAKSQFEIQRMQAEAELKRELMQTEFQFKLQLARAESETIDKKSKEEEDRKDERVRIQGTQQSELIDQRKNDLLPKNFESAGNDNLGGFGFEQFSVK